MPRPRAILSATLLILLACTAPLPTNAQAIKVYWADEFAGRVYASDPDGSNLETVITGDYLDSEEIVVGGGKLYWSDAGRGLIQRADPDGSNLETVIESPEPGALGLDVDAGKLYWIDNVLGEIRRANLDGTSQESVQALASPGTALMIDVLAQVVLWAEYDASLFQSFLYRRPVAGGPPQQVVTIQGTDHVRGLALGEAGFIAYFGLGPQLMQVEAAGGFTTTLYSGGVDISAVSVDILGGKIYWSDAGNSDITRSELDGGGLEVLETFARNADGLAMDPATAKLYWTEERSVVRAELDGTGQTNIVTRPAYFAVGYHEALGRLYYSDMHDLVTYYADANGTNETPFWSGSSPATGGALAIDVDQDADKIYWLDGGDRRLRRADPDGGALEDLFLLDGDAYAFALDLPGGRVYWCGRATGAIYRRDLDGSGTTETVYTGLDLPRGLALDHTYGRVLWGEDHRLACGPLDGGPVSVIVTDPFAVIGVVWDDANERVYWADQLNSRVRRAAYDAGAGAWLAPETIFSQGFEHWPGRLALQYGEPIGVSPGVVRTQEHSATPNPFNPSTLITFRTREDGWTSLGIYDPEGRLVRELFARTWLPAGSQHARWDGRDTHGRNVASGAYVYRIETRAGIMTGKVMMLK